MKGVIGEPPKEDFTDLAVLATDNKDCIRLVDDLSASKLKTDTWESLKKELKNQFLSYNTSLLAKENQKKLKHIGSMWDYIKKFSLLMLDIQNMHEEDKLFNLTSGL
ncbi:hypothetical protein Ddye_021555 [Dipteronia dyeriana]|uniref:Retrotransposon gag domain-containing protein n=1 Tax=Dipteronia dyeriana TaxID=168575 RepID=A0AAD9U2W2_9ROSI|nr:hypothetical protein Ddye_021555 [Dipteronia dyeriana]